MTTNNAWAGGKLRPAAFVHCRPSSRRRAATIAAVARIKAHQLPWVGMSGHGMKGATISRAINGGGSPAPSIRGTVARSAFGMVAVLGWEAQFGAVQQRFKSIRWVVQPNS